MAGGILRGSGRWDEWNATNWFKSECARREKMHMGELLERELDLD
jgi:hypothetical protein